MNCPKCGHGVQLVVDSRPTDDRVRRRRECCNKQCRHRFTTLETYAERNDRPGPMYHFAGVAEATEQVRLDLVDRLLGVLGLNIKQVRRKKK